MNVGNIYSYSSTSVKYSVTSMTDLEVIIEHFNKYFLQTQKFADFELFKQAFYIIKNKEHLTKQGLQKVIAIKASLNLGLSDELKASFPDITPAIRPITNIMIGLDPN